MSLRDSLEVEMKRKTCSSHVPISKAVGKEAQQTGSLTLSITIQPAKVSATQSIANTDGCLLQCQAAFTGQRHVHT